MTEEISEQASLFYYMRCMRMSYNYQYCMQRECNECRRRGECNNERDNQQFELHNRISKRRRDEQGSGQRGHSRANDIQGTTNITSQRPS